ncbi:MAG TPA: response regulator transcription factor [Acidimicrobiia bacterium]|nr:response regulator transcription factor [Acidimicrobiia bacterium]
MRLLIVEDDEDVIGLLRRALSREGHVLDVTENGADALWLAAECSYDVIILDVNVPPPDGFEICRRLRRSGDWTPVLFLTGRQDVADRVAGLDSGGDDYLAKPFSLEELNARLRAVARRRSEERPTVLRVGDLEVDPATRTVRRGQQDIQLTAKEFALLELLARRPGEVVTRSSIVNALYDFAFDARSNVVEALVRRLRDKVDRPFGRTTVQTVRGSGYRLSP